MVNILGINLWNWCKELGNECCGIPTKIKEMGFTAVEVPMTSSTISRVLREEIRDTELQVSLCAAMGKGRDLSSFDSYIREDTMKYLTECLQTGAMVNAKVFCGPLYAGGGKRHWLAEEEKKREWELAVTGIRELAYRAKEYGIELSLEPLNRYRTSVVNTVKQVLEMVKEIDAPNVGIHYDTFHACLEEKDLPASLEMALQSGKVNHFHACANNRGAPGQGVIPWEAILDLLVNYHYMGHITMETFAIGGLDSSWIQVHEEPDVLAKAGLRYLRDYFERKEKYNIV